MYNFHDENGNQANLERGCKLIWYPTDGTFKICPPQVGLKSRPSFRWSGDDKRIVNFIRSSFDFEEFVQIIAEIHGLKTQLIRNDQSVMMIELV